MEETVTVEPSIPESKPQLTSRRRRHDEDEDDENGHTEDLMELDEENAKRRRTAGGVDIGPKLLKMIKKLDEDLTGPVTEAIENLASVLEENFDPYEERIIGILYECVAYLPEKITVFSTLVGILNSKSPEFGGAVLSRLFDELNNTIATEQYDITLRIVTFLCDLANSKMVTIGSIVHFLKDFVDLALEENVKSDYLVLVVLHTLPWIGPEMHEKLPKELEAMLKRIEHYLKRRQKLHMKMLRVWSTTEPHTQEDYLDCLWTQLNKLRQDSWLEKHILRPYVNFDTVLNAAEHHELPRVDLALLKNSKNYPLPRVVFRLFDQSDCPDNLDQSLPPESTIERFLVEEDLNWIIDNNYTDWKLCAKALLNYHRRDTVPLNYVVIEVVFGQLFRLPTAPHLELFYGALFIELCRSQASSMPQVLAQAAELLYQRADTMQPICLDRFVNWFSYHLSNFEYRWSWADWADCLELDSLSPKRIFVREVVEKCMRLSYHKKVAEFLPPEFEPIIPEEPTIIYVLDDSSHPAYQQAQQFQEMILDKRSDDEILIALRKTEHSDDIAIDEDGGADGDKVKPPKESVYSADSVAVFLSVLLKQSAKTITHTFAALAKYQKLFSKIAENNEEIQSTILRTLYDSWNLHKQMMTILVDKMLKMYILDPAVVQAWVFCDDMKREFKRSWVWDVLNSALDRCEDDSEQRDIFLSICHKFTLILTEHLLNCETDGTEIETDFYNYVTGRFRYIFLKHCENMWTHVGDLERELFSSPTIDARIREIFNQFKSLKRV